MMFAMRLERNVAQQHDLVIAADLLEGARQMDRGILVIALAIFLPSPRDAARRIAQALARRVVARPIDQPAYGVCVMAGHDLFSIGPQFTFVVAHRQLGTASVQARAWRYV